MRKKHIRRQCYYVTEPFSYNVSVLKSEATFCYTPKDLNPCPSLQSRASCPCCLSVGTRMSLITAAVIALGTSNTQRHQGLATKKHRGHNFTTSLCLLEPISHLCPCKGHKKGVWRHRWGFKAASIADTTSNLNST